MPQPIATSTLAEVARAAGVSTASASRALAGRAGVSPELHSRIMAAAARLGYRGNWAARALASNRSRLVGVIMDAPCDASMSVILQSVERGFEQRGYACLFTLPTPPERYIPAITALLARGVEGIVFAGASPEIQDIDALAAQAVPWVAIGEGEDADPRRIVLGRVAGGELATRYLAELGHERLAVLAFDDRHGQSVGRIFAPGKVTVTQARAAISDPVGFKVAIRDVLDLPRRPTAIVCGTDVDALVALRECSLRGMRVPQDISIIGFGDEPFARHTVPALTTVRISAGEIGLRAAEALRMFLVGQPCEPYRPSVKLVIRETVGPAG